MRDIHKEQINEIEIRLSNSKQSEALLIDEVSKLKNDCITQQAQYDSEHQKLQQTINDQSVKYAKLLRLKFINGKTKANISLLFFFAQNSSDRTRSG